jgi:hypothetical protein
MITQAEQYPTNVSKDRYQAEASVMSGNFRQPLKGDISDQGSHCIASGWHTYRAAEAFRLSGLLAFGSGYDAQAPDPPIPEPSAPLWAKI